MSESPPSSLTEHEIVELSDLMNEYEPRLNDRLRRRFPGIDHENAIGQALLEMTESWRQITGDKRAWLNRVASRRCIDAWRASQRQGASLDEPRMATLQLAWVGPDEYAVLLVYRAIATLPQHLRFALAKKMFGDEVDEIARLMNRSPRTVEDYILRARTYVRALVLDASSLDSEGTLP
ncbi:sigma-70 family RNA polymerase sigma factor [Amycolatopsis sp. PS_44_ISF1]|uniref:RNA polymerase sigma factor n=1 Tax=Amycolatopsis sp. PS_44_ISF1 TaxID=2974917 RepID=UPI0028DD8618|nr:sigma-70 family RNA polymerase sigma factor [Amycolatopsis sp. PS_44_ISF1]MDT8913734.1 sigma-70 family RNA polymerase sigma factor [Amycolatopsis sp. PS_44_ISF1]MDT8916205.1 sigma-70 family RNA polymerase sigma factor [Amycolatopsis sp. PS_44_ISF1]